jgi:hypothetical protein
VLPKRTTFAQAVHTNGAFCYLFEGQRESDNPGEMKYSDISATP